MPIYDWTFFCSICAFWRRIFSANLLDIFWLDSVLDLRIIELSEFIDIEIVFKNIADFFLPSISKLCIHIVCAQFFPALNVCIGIIKNSVTHILLELFFSLFRELRRCFLCALLSELSLFFIECCLSFSLFLLKSSLLFLPCSIFRILFLSSDSLLSFYRILAHRLKSLFLLLFAKSFKNSLELFICLALAISRSIVAECSKNSFSLSFV